MSDSRKTLSARGTSPVEAFLGKVAETPSMPQLTDVAGRLIFGMDATASREATWSEARKVQGEMFAAASATGGLAIQLCHYQGMNGFGVSPWMVSADSLKRRMREVSCLGGLTQIGRLFEHVIEESRLKPVAALVFVGDCVEEDIDHLCHLAGKMALNQIRAFLFQEGEDPEAERAFRQIARLTGGAHCRFDAGSAGQLRDLLTAVAVYASGGLTALQDFGRRRGGGAIRLIRDMQAS